MDFLLKLFFKPKEKGTGWLTDPQDDRAYKHEEVADIGKAAGLVWVEKAPNTWRKFLPIRNQNGSSACVAFATALLLGILNYMREGKFVVLAPKFIYSRGFVPNGGGMYFYNGMSIGAKEGCPLDVLAPSDNITEVQARDNSQEKEGDRQVAKVYGLQDEEIVYLPLDFDIIGSVIDLGVPVLAGLRFESGGLSGYIAKLTQNGFYGHGVALTDRSLVNGEKGLVYQNSWGEDWGIGGLGIVPESQKAGVQFAAYYKKFERKVLEGLKPKLKLSANTYLTIGSTGSAVVKAQTMLQMLGYFPAAQECTGNFYGITRQAVRDFQKAKNLTVDGVVSGATISELNKLFA